LARKEELELSNELGMMTGDSDLGHACLPAGRGSNPVIGSEDLGLKKEKLEWSDEGFTTWVRLKVIHAGGYSKQ